MRVSARGSRTVQSAVRREGAETRGEPGRRSQGRKARDARCDQECGGRPDHVSRPVNELQLTPAVAPGTGGQHRGGDEEQGNGPEVSVEAREGKGPGRLPSVNCANPDTVRPISTNLQPQIQPLLPQLERRRRSRRWGWRLLGGRRRGHKVGHRLRSDHPASRCHALCCLSGYATRDRFSTFGALANLNLGGDHHGGWGVDERREVRDSSGSDGRHSREAALEVRAVDPGRRGRPGRSARCSPDQPDPQVESGLN